METHGKNYKATALGDIAALGRQTLKEDLGLTGSEISLNELPAGAGVPFLHAHTRNEEVYIILKGKGLFQVDGEEFPVEEGSVVRVDPAGARCLKADAQSPLRYLCIQTDAGSLRQHTQTDGVILEAKPVWTR